MTQKTRLLQEEPDKKMLTRLRVLEKKMGLVLTLVNYLSVFPSV
jgi:DASH complex subunit DAD3